MYHHLQGSFVLLLLFGNQANHKGRHDGHGRYTKVEWIDHDNDKGKQTIVLWFDREFLCT